MSSFTVIPAQESFKLDAERVGQVIYSVKNTSNRPMRAQFDAIVDGATNAAWLSVKDPLRELLASETQNVAIQVSVPPEVAQGAYQLHLRVAAEADPGTDFMDGQVVSIVVPPRPPVPIVKGGKWKWWMTVLVVVAMFIVASVALKMILDPTKQAATPAASAASASAPSVAASVPDVTYGTLADAQAKILAQHLNLKLKTTEVPITGDLSNVNLIVSQQPIPDAPLPQDSTISVTVDVAGVPVPHVAGMAPLAAAVLLGQRNLTFNGVDGDGSPGPKFDPTSPAVGTYPPEGAPVAEHGLVTVLVKGPKQIAPWMKSVRPNFLQKAQTNSK